ncbi:MAG: RNA-binding transcriptional accessory protein [Epulopiscium sp.]|nr:RNA-binding transcriptional accessory protein [Candidatus Epulonipiscium sp.]
MDIIKILQTELSLKPKQVKNTIELIDEGNTIPFIARYRKEATGSLSDEVLRDFNERLEYLRNLEAKKEQVIESIKEQEALTPELKAKIEKATTITQVDDLYLPYRPKRRTRAIIAKEKGLEPLANLILAQEEDIDPLEQAKEYISEEKGVETAQDALDGAKDIIAEIISDNADYRSYIRDFTFNKGRIVTKARNDEESTVFDMYYDYDEEVKSIPGHRILAINRGEKEKVLSVKIEISEDDVYRYLGNKIIKCNFDNIIVVIKEVIEDAYKRLIAPAIEREIRNMLTEKAEDGALIVFRQNLNQLLMQAPIQNRVVLGVDPAYRTGCKIAVVDGTGKKLDDTVIFPTPPRNEIEKSERILMNLIEKYDVDLIAIGNGTASRESEKFVADMIKKIDKTIHYVIVNEAGASVYSASKLAAEEFPKDDVGVRSAVSIARRIQDPLAELVKIDPKSIGVGQYQHDMNQKRLEETLGGVVEDTVNSVGVDINTASVSLLEYVAGIKKSVARNIVLYREENGKFQRRTQIKKVKGLGPKAFEQSAGFLRIMDGSNPLDRTGIHPESYLATEDLLKELGYNKDDISSNQTKDISKKINDISSISEKLDIGEITLNDILKELEKPGRDPREDMEKPILHSEVLEIKDLEEGMILKGTVRNIVDFGAFVDIGVHQDGLVHISKMAERYIKHPLDVVSVGDIVEVKVISVDVERSKIGLSMVI